MRNKHYQVTSLECTDAFIAVADCHDLLGAESVVQDIINGSPTDVTDSTLIGTPLNGFKCTTRLDLIIFG